MNFDLTDEHKLIRHSARDFAERTLKPKAQARDHSGEFPEAELRALGELGLLAVAVPDAYGGAEAGAVAFSLVMQELARADASVAVAVSVTNMVGELIAAAGSEAQKREHVPKLASGDYLCGSFALSEPHAGSDPSALRTRAEQTGKGWKLFGTKQWITSGDRAGLIVVWAMTEPGQGHRGLSAFLVRRDAPGLSVSKSERKMGLHGSSTVQLSLDGVEVAQDDMLGAPGAGFALAMKALDGGRIGIASQAIGIAQGAFESAWSYAGQREQFGKPILGHQAIANMLADAATWIDAARLMTLQAAWRKQAGLAFTKQASMAKLFATEHALKACDIAIQIHGGYGYTHDFPVERAYRDARATTIYEGTSEIQRLIIARHLIKEGAA